jgi:hypothetical protein
MTEANATNRKPGLATGFLRHTVLRSSAAEVLGVLAFVFFPLIRQVVGGEDRRDRTDGDAGAAVDTLDWIYEKLLRFGVRTFVLLGVDAIHWACIDARRVLGTNAGFCDYVCHFCFLSNEKRRE